MSNRILCWGSLEPLVWHCSSLRGRASEALFPTPICFYVFMAGTVQFQLRRSTRGNNHPHLPPPAAQTGSLASMCWLLLAAREKAPLKISRAHGAHLWRICKRYAENDFHRVPITPTTRYYSDAPTESPANYTKRLLPFKGEKDRQLNFHK